MLKKSLYFINSNKWTKVFFCSTEQESAIVCNYASSLENFSSTLLSKVPIETSKVVKIYFML